MFTTSDFNMLGLEAPQDIRQIADGTEPVDKVVEVENPAGWVRSLVHQQEQAKADLRQLWEVSGSTLDRTNRWIHDIERAYMTLAQGTQYIYDRIRNQENITESWVQNELAAAANAYQNFAQQVWQEIIDRTNEADLRQKHQGTQLARLHDALAFLTEANTARSRHLALFQRNMEEWAQDHQACVATLEQRLAQAQEEIRKVAVQVALLTMPPAAPILNRPSSIPRLGLGNPAPQASAPYVPLGATGGNGGGRPPRAPRRPAVPPSPSSPPPESDNDDDNDLYERNLRTGQPPPGAREQTRPELATMLRPEEIAQLVGEGIAAVRQGPAPEQQLNTCRLKMKSPDTFNGKSSTNFNQWWEAVVMYLGFYPETVDRQKIAWIGTLLTDTALLWHLQRYRELNDADTWVNYLAALRAAYHSDREAADAQLKLGQLKYHSCIRT